MKQNRKVEDIFDYVQVCIDEGVLSQDAKQDIEQVCTEIFNLGHGVGFSEGEAYSSLKHGSKDYHEATTWDKSTKHGIGIRRV